MNEEQIFYVDEFLNEIVYQINSNYYTKQEKFMIVYQAINKLVRMPPEIRDSQALVNGMVFLLGFLNNRPVDGFTDRRPMQGNNKKEYVTILKNEFTSN